MKYIFSMKVAVLMMFIFAIVIGIGTFIENDYGTQTARALIYKAGWFEVFLGYFIAILIYNIIKFKSHKSKPAVFLFHFSFVVVALGALLTRYIGYEGIMHIRTGDSSNTMVSDVKIIQIQAQKADKTVEFEKEMFFSTMTPNSFDKTISVADKEVKIELLKYMPTYEDEIVSDSNGKKILEFKVATGANGKIYYLSKGEKRDFGSFVISYGADVSDSKKTIFSVTDDGDKLRKNSPKDLITLDMNDQSQGELKSGNNLLRNRMLYRFDGNAIVLKQVHPKAIIKVKESTELKTKRRLPEYMQWKVSVGDKSQIVVTTPYKGQIGTLNQISLDGVDIKLQIGAKLITVPFDIKLIKFTLERYPGSMTPASYSSDVVLIDKEQNINMPYKIYMNHILDHRNYRVFQSSYDQDEQGTVLSINHDPGTIPTYIGYFLMMIGMIWSLFISNGRFQKLLKGTRKLQSGALAIAMITLLALSPTSLEAKTPILDANITKNMQSYDFEHAQNFGKIVVQDGGGRMKPIDTVAHDVISKITGKSSILGLSPTQMLLGMTMQPALYQTIPMIKIGHKKIAVELGLPEDTKFARFLDFFSKEDFSYRIFKVVTEASRKKPLEKTQFDKELLKIDERVNVAYMSYQGAMLKMYPKPNDINNKWFSPMDAIKDFPPEDRDAVRISISAYFSMIETGLKTGNWANANIALKGISQYQQKYGARVIPSPTHIDMEIAYNKFGLFGKLVPLYLLLGLILLVFAFINVIKTTFSLKYIMMGAWGIFILGFALHILGLGIRWYIAGHAPWSNAYESIVTIAATTMFAGIILARRSPFALAGAGILAGVTMAVAHMSFLNPEITTLVPVLKSYWLMIHVATIISGDGFLGLGSILSLLVLILYIMRGKNGDENIDRSIKELTNLSEMALIIGLILLTVGNFLGGVWANESWGRYWGWDAKETWAAVSILVYATVLHLRFIPSLKSNFAYNVATTWAYSSVLMTYFGVNYYLSGLHSYAAGDPVPIPMWIYYAIAGLFVLTLISARNRKLK